MTRQLRQGAGWRLGWDPVATEFQGLVGSADWAVELTGPEFEAFCHLMLQLAETLKAMREELMEEEAIACEAANEHLWMEVRGVPQAYHLSFIVLQGRRAEGEWPPAATMALLEAIHTLKLELGMPS